MTARAEDAGLTPRPVASSAGELAMQRSASRPVILLCSCRLGSGTAFHEGHAAQTGEHRWPVLGTEGMEGGLSWQR